MEDRDSQTDEISALQSIFSEEEFKSNCENGVYEGHFYIFFTFPEGYKVMIKNEKDVNREGIMFNIHFLPPIEIVFTLPPDYPSRAPPWFTISCPWLTKESLVKLCEKMDQLWEENKGSEILYNWTQFLKEESLSFLGIVDKLEISLTKIQKEIKQEVQDSETPQQSIETDKSLPSNNLSKTNTAENFNVNDSSSRSSQNNGSSSRECTEVKNIGTSRELNRHKTQTYLDKREMCTNSCVSNNPEGEGSSHYENNYLPQTKSTRNYIRNNEFRDDNKRRNYSRFNSENNEYFRRYERRNPQFYEGCDHKPSGYRNTTHYKRHKSPIEKKILDNSLKKVENCESELTFNESQLVDEKVTTDNLEGKRIFEKNKRYQNNYNGGTESSYNKPRRMYNDNRPRRMYNQFMNESQCFYNSRYQARRGKNRNFTKVHTSNNDTSKIGDKIETMVANLNISKEKDCDEVQKNNELKVDVPVEESMVEKRVKDHIGQFYNAHVHLFLQSYDEDRAKIEFLRNIYPCSICFQDKPGVESTQFLPCKHVFCRECIGGYFETRIKEGTVNNIRCPEDKCTSEAIPPQIKDIVSPELFARYDSILLSTTLETMMDIVYCPRSSCQYPTTKEEESRMARCPACKYAFCIYCKMVYHGVEPCRFKQAERLKICEDYQYGNEDMKLYLEQKYGKKQLTMLLDMALSEEWIDGNSKRCPSCNSAIEKSEGCNKMLCTKCDTFFCWECKAKLDRVVPYKHYSDPLSPCFNRLYIVDDENL